MIPVRLPDGRTVNVNTNDPAVAAKAAHSFRTENPHPEKSTWNTIAGLAGDVADGMLPGASGAIRGVRQAVVNAVQAPFSPDVDFHPVESYREGRAFQEARQKQANADHPALASTAQVAGVLSGIALPAAKVARGATIGAKALAGAKTAGAYGALSGALSSRRDTALGVANDTLAGGLIGGGIGVVLPHAVKAATTWAAPVLAGIYGAGHGALSSEEKGWLGKAEDAAEGAALGAGIGAVPSVAAKGAARFAGRGLQAVSNYLPGRFGGLAAAEGRQLTRDPARTAANRIVNDAIRSDINPATGRRWTPAEVSATVQARQAAGVPAAPADLSESARRSFGAAARTPGPATAAVRRMIDQRQESQGIRLADQVRSHLGPTANVERQANAIQDAAQAAARPHYDAAYAAPGASDSQIADILDNQSSAMGSAFGHARELALRDKRDPTALGFDIDNLTNEVSLNRVPSFETLDLVKRGLEGVADGKRNALGRINNDGRTILNMSRPLVARMREVNPHYAAALDTYGGEISGRDAILAGRESLKDGADDLANVTDGFTPWERQNFALGHRSAMANDMSDFARKTPYGNAAARLRQNFGLPGTDTYRALQDIHGPAAIDNLAGIGEAEHQANQTYQAIRGNSATMDRAAEDAAQEKQIADAASGAWGAMAHNPITGAWKIAKALKGGETLAGQAETQGRIASILGDLNPVSVRANMRQIGRERARGALSEQTKGKALSQTSKIIGALSAAGMVQPFVEPDNNE